ncbi:gamma-glutamyl hydrolase A-like [Tropilaelaps mercedesae]|uniref:folate gamma-glutamyl hydrolase n=1 Tax=Tropilaelaps mercedesae TaxID=418985 RepID=A0A1V9XEP0_9ACAR|nr:gamma-glutamyl hydrolase A-like [Tropilaelaps mercedesae]
MHTCLSVLNHVGRSYTGSLEARIRIPASCGSQPTTAAATEVLVYKVSGPRSGDEITHILAEPAPYVYVNPRPVIGILAQDYYGPVENKTSFIAASYVKWIEGAGARVLPIFLNKTEAYYDEVINLVNGVLFPGGQQRALQCPAFRVRCICVAVYGRVLYIRVPSESAEVP